MSLAQLFYAKNSAKQCPKTQASRPRRHRVRPRRRPFLLEPLEPRVLLSAVLWDGGGDGLNWNDPRNWNTDTLPTVSDDVVIDVPGNITVTHATGADAVRSLTTNDALVISGGSLSISQASEIQAGGSLTVLGGAAFGEADGSIPTLTNRGVIDLRGGAIAVTELDNDGQLLARNGVSTLGGTLLSTTARSKIEIGGGMAGNATLTTPGFTNAGRIELTSTDGVSEARLAVAGALVNASSGVIASLLGTGGPRTLSAFSVDNQGSIDVEQTLALPAAEVNTTVGTVNVAAGQMLQARQAGELVEVDADSLKGSGTLDLFGARLDLTGDVTLESGGPQLALAFSTVEGTGRLVNRGTLELATNTVNTSLLNEGHLTVHGGSATVEELTTDTPAGPRSTIEIGGGAGGTAALTVNHGFTNSGDISLTSAQGAFEARLTVQGALVNQSLIASLPGTGGDRTLQAFTIEDQTVFGVIDVSQPLTVLTGELNATSGNLALGATLTVPNALVRIQSSSNLSGTETLKLFNGRLDIAGEVVLTDTGPKVDLGFASVQGTGRLINRRTTLDLTDSTVFATLRNEGGVVVQGGSATIGGTLETTPGSSIDLNGGSGGNAILTVAQGFTNEGRIEFSVGGSSSEIRLELSSGTLVNDSDASIVSLPGQGTRALVGGLDNRGLLDVQQSLTLTPSGGRSFSNSGTVHVASGETFTLSDGFFADLDPGNTLHGGTYNLSGVFALSNIFTVPGVALVFPGGDLIHGLAAAVTLDGPGAAIRDSSGGDAMAPLASIAQTGSLTIRGGRDFSTSGDLTNAGTLALEPSDVLAPTVTVAGAFVQTASGTFQIDIKGRTPGEAFGRLMAIGAVGLDGRLSVKTGTLVPAPADAFTIITGATRSGMFAVVDGTELPGVVFGPEYDPDGVRLVAAHSDIVRWDGGGDGIHWSDPLNWDIDALPVASSQVIIQGPADGLGVLDVQHDLSGATIRSLLMTGNASLALTAGSLSIVEDSSIAGALVLSGGSLGLENSLDVAGLTWTAGTVSGPGRLRLVQGGEGSISGDGLSRLMGGRLTNEGTIVIDGVFAAGDGAAIDNVGTLTLLDGGAIREDAASSVAPSLLNDVGAVIGRSFDSLAQTRSAAVIGIAIENDGALESSNGQFDLTGSGTLAGSVNAVSGMLRFAGGHYTVAPGAKVLVTRIIVDAGELSVLTEAANHQVFTYEVDGGTLALETSDELLLGNVELKGGTLTGQAALGLQGTMTWSGGTLAGPSEFTVRPGAHVDVEGSGDKVLLGRTIAIDGALTVEGGELRAGQGALLAIHGSGEMTLLTGAVLRRDLSLGGSASLLNSGTLRRDSHDDPLATNVAATVATVLMPLDSTGEGRIRIDHGILKLADAGDVSGQVILNGVDEVGVGAGTLELAGTGYTFSASSLITDLIGAGPAAGAGRLDVTGGDQQVQGGLNVGGLSLDDGSLVIETSGGVAVGTFEERGGELSGTDLTITEDFLWTGGTQRGPGFTELGAGASGRIREPGDKVLAGRAIRNEGELFWIDGDIRVGGPGIVNLPGAVLNLDPRPGQFGSFIGPGVMTVLPGFGVLDPVIDNLGRILVGELGSTARISIGIDNSGSIELLPLSRLNLVGGLQQTADGSLTGEGTVNFIAGNSLLRGGFAADSVVVGELGGVASPTVTFDVGAAAAARIWDIKGGSLVINGDATDVQAGTGGFFVQSGALARLETGTLRAEGGVEVRAGGVLEGVGTIVGTVVNAGTVRPGDPLGVLSVDGSFAQVATGLLEVEIAGLTPDSEYDRLAVTGGSALGGALAIVRVNGFVPAVGDAFDVVTHTSVTGGFAAVTGTAIDLRRHFTTAVSSEAVRLLVEGGSAPEVVAAAVAAINDGLSGFAGSTGLLAQWGALFNLASWHPDFASFGLPQFDFPVVGKGLDTAFGLGGRLGSLNLGRLDQTAAPDGLIDTLAELLDTLAALPHITIDAAAGGVDGHPDTSRPGDLFIARFDTTFGNLLGTLGFNGGTPILAGLASAAALDGPLSWLGDLGVDLSFGVDEQGFFLSGLSGLRLDLTSHSPFDPNAPALAGVGSIGGFDGLALFGGVTGSLDIGLGPALTGTRFRLPDLAAAAASYLVPTLEGHLDLDIRVDTPALNFDWTGGFGFATAGRAVTPEFTQALSGTLRIPDFTSSDGTPGRLDFTGAFSSGAWTLTLAGGLPTLPVLHGFTIDNLDASMRISPTTFAGHFAGDTSVQFGTQHDRFTLHLDGSFDPARMDLFASLPIPDTPIGEPTILILVNPALTVSLDFDFSGGDVTGGLAFSADLAILFPGRTGELFTGSAEQVLGTVDAATGAFDARAARVSLEVGKSVEATANAVHFAFNPTATGVVTIAQLRGVTVEFPSLPDFPTATVDNLDVQLDTATQTFTIEVQGLEIRGDSNATTAVTTLAALSLAAASGSAGASTSDLGAATASLTTTAAVEASHQPVLIVPDIGRSLPLDPTHKGNFERWLLSLGVSPDTLGLDPLGHAYDDLIQSLVAAGYTVGKDLFFAPWDWRLPLAPSDGVEDGKLTGLTGELLPTDGRQSITDDAFSFGLDYLGHALRSAADAYLLATGTPLAHLTIIGHGAGGLLARAYVQSDAYGEQFDPARGLSLPTVDSLLLVGVPNLGEVDAWSVLQDDWQANPFYRTVLRPIVNLAFQEVSRDAKTVHDPNGQDITAASILDPGTAAADSQRFIEQYVPIFRDLVPIANALGSGSGGTGGWVEQGPRPVINAQVSIAPDNPASGAVESIAVDPQNPQQMYVGTANGGVWRAVWRTDAANLIDPGSVTWTPLTDQQPSLAIGSVAFSPLDARTIYASTGSFSNFLDAGGPAIGILRTTDGGSTWENFIGAISSEPRIKTVLPTAIDLDSGPDTRELVLAAAIGSLGGGIYRSDDGGQTFSLLTDNGLPAGEVSQLIVDPNNVMRFYAGLPRQGVFRGDFNPASGVITWTPVNSGISNIDSAANIQLAAGTAGGATVLYAGLANRTPEQLTGVFRSLDGGGAWTALGTPSVFKPGVLEGSGFSMETDPTDGQIVYIGGMEGTVFRYDPAAPSGTNPWVSIVGAGSQSTSPHDDLRDLAFIGTNVLVEADDGGIYFLQNPRDAADNRWQSFIGEPGTGQALGVVELHDIAWDSNSNIILGGSQDNGTAFQQKTGDLVWNHLDSGDGGDVAVDNFTLAAQNQSIRYSSSQFLGFQVDFFGFSRRVFDANNQPVGSSVFLIPSGGLDGFVPQAVTPLAVNAIAPTADQLAAGQSTRIVIGGAFNEAAVGTSVDPAGAVYESSNAGTANESLVTGDSTVTWVRVPTLPGSGFAGVNSMAYGGRRLGQDNPDVLYVGSGSQVFVRTGERTSTGNFTPTGGMLMPTSLSGAGTIRDIVMDPDDWMTAYAIDNHRVFVTNDAGGHWRDITGNLIDDSLTTIAFVPGAGVAAVVVGSANGVHRMLTTSEATWSPLGAGLPNALVYDLDYNKVDDVLVAGTLGRGAWTLSHASATVLLVGAGDLNAAPDLKNSFLLDLDASLAAYDRANTPTVTIVEGLSQATPTSLIAHRGPVQVEPAPLLPLAAQQTVEPAASQAWFEDVSAIGGGDGAVSLASAVGPFSGQKNVTVIPFAHRNSPAPGETSGSVDHSALPSNADVQRAIFQVLGIGTAAAVSTGHALTDYQSVMTTTRDPVEGFLIDPQGGRLGFTAADGAVAEIASSAYFGEAAGIGWVFDPGVGDYQQQLTSLGGDFFVQTSVGGGLLGGDTLVGSAAAGASVADTFNLARVLQQLGIPDLLEVRNPALLANLTITVGPGTADVTGTIALTADGAALLPDGSTPELDGVATANNLFGQIDLKTGAVTLAASRADLHLGGAVRASATGGPDDPATPEPENPGIEIVIDPTDTDPSAVIATVRNLHFDIAELPGLGDLVALNLVEIRKNGLQIAATFGGPNTDITLGTNPVLLQLEGLEVQLDVNVTVGPNSAQVIAGTTVGGSVSVSAASGTLFPGQTSTLRASLAGFSGSIANLSDPLDTLDLTAASVRVSAGDLVAFEADGIAVDLDPGAGQPVATLDNAALTVSIPGLEALAGSVVAQASDVRIFRSGIDAGSFSASVPGPIGGSEGLFSLSGLSIDVANLSVDFDAPVAEAGSVQVRVGSASFNLPGVTASLAPDPSGPGHPALVGTIQAGQAVWSFGVLTAEVAGLVSVEATGGTLAFGPGTTRLPLLAVEFAALRLPLLNGRADLEVSGLLISRQGTFTIQSAGLRSDGLFHTLGFGDLLPFDLTSVALEGLGGGPIRLDRFRLDVSGTLDVSIFDFAAGAVTPTFSIGDFAPLVSQSLGMGFEFNDGSLKVGRVLAGNFVPLSGVVTGGFQGLALGPMAVGASLSLGQFIGGVYTFNAVGASLDVRMNQTEVIVAGLGQFSAPDGQGARTFDLALDLGFSFDSGPGAAAHLHVEDFHALFDLDIRLGAQFQVLASTVQLTDITVGQVVVTFGDAGDPLLQFQSQSARLNFSDRSQPFMTFGSLTASFPALTNIQGFQDLTGIVSNFAIGQDFSFEPLNGFGVEFHGLPTPQAFGLPDWFPLRLDGLGLVLGPQALRGNPQDIVFILSGGLVASQDFPIEATIDDLRVNVGKLAQGQLLGALEGLDGFFVGMKPFKIGDALKVGGGFGLGIVQDNTGQSDLYARIDGYFEISGIGAGIELIVTEYGPILGKIDAPVGVPLDPAGAMVLTNVTGGFAFGGPAFTAPEDPKDLLNARTTFAPISFAQADIDNAIRALLHENADRKAQGLSPRFTWDESFTLALAGDFTSLEAPGILTATLNLAANVAKVDGRTSVKFLGSGIAEVFGMPLGAVGAQLDFTDPLAPVYNLAFAAPTPGNPLAFLFPAQAEFTVRLDTDGLLQGTAIGLRTFVDQLAGGGLNVVATRIAESLQADRTRPLAVLLLDGQGNVPFIDAPFVLGRLRALLPAGVGGLATLDLGRTATLVEAFLSEALQAGGRLDPAQGAQLLQSLDDTLKSATLAALNAGFDAFNPRLELNGLLQPTILGIPFGQPDDQVSLVLDKGGIGFGFGTSFQKLAERLANSIVPGIGGFFLDLLSLGFQDHINLDFKLGLSGVFQSLLGGHGLPAIDPLGDWTVGVTGRLNWLGFEIGQVSGFVFSPHSPEIDAHVQKVFELPDTNPLAPLPPLGPDGKPVLTDLKIPIATQAQYDNLVQFGGIIVTGQLLAPALLMDPVGLLSRMNDPNQDGRTDDSLFTPPKVTGPLDLFNFGPYIQNLADALLASQEFARMQLYVPGFSSVLDVDTSGGSAVAVARGTIQQFQTIASTGYLTGFADRQILSIDLARAAVNITPDGIQVTAGIPWLAALEAQVGVNMRDVNLNELVEDLAAKSGFPGLDLTNSATPLLSLPVPVAMASVSLSTDRLRNLLSDKFGLPAAVFGPAANTAEASLSIFSPAFGDPTDPVVPLAQRNGGVQLDARLNVQGLITNAQFHFEAPLFTDIVPQFVASATVDTVTLPGVTVHNASVGIVHDSTGARLHVDGQANLFGEVVEVKGDLAIADLTGSLSVQFGPGQQPDTGALTLRGDFTVVLSRTTGNQLTSELRFDGQLILPSWLAAASGQANAQAHGSFTTAGEMDLTVTLQNFAFGPSGAVKIVGTDFPKGPNNAAIFELLRDQVAQQFRTTLHIDGELALGANSAIPLLAISGDLSDVGSGDLVISFGSAGLSLSGFAVLGGATLHFDPAAFTIAVNGLLTIPNLITKATVTGGMDQNGIQQLAVAAGGFSLPPLQVSNVGLSIRRSGTTPTNFSYALHAQGAATFTPFFQSLAISGDLDSLGNGALSITLGKASLNVFGFPITSVTDSHFTIIKSGAALSLDLRGQMTFLGNTLAVQTLPSAPLVFSSVLGTNRLTGAVQVAFNPGQQLNLGGFGVTGTATLNVLATSASLRIDGSLALPSIVGSISVGGSLVSNGTGSLTVAAPNGLRVGNANSPLLLTGAFTLGSTTPDVFFFQATNVSAAWTGIGTFGPITQFFIDTAGRFDMDFGGEQLVFGNSTTATRDNFLWLDIPSLKVHVDPTNQQFQLLFGTPTSQPTLNVPGIATGLNRLTVPNFAITINNSDFSEVLASGQLNLGVMTLTGRLVFERVNGVYRLSVLEIPGIGKSAPPPIPPRLAIPALVTLDLNEFSIASDGTFSVQAASEQIGPSALNIQGASILVEKTGPGLTSFKVDVDGGQLHLPFGNPINLPHLEFDSSAHFSQNFTLPSLDLGPAFRTTGNATFTASASNGVLDLKKTLTSAAGAVDIRVLAGSLDMNLQSFEARSDGFLTGQVTGKLQIGDYQLAQATLAVTKNGNVLRMSIPSANPVSVDLGFLTANFSGFVQSDGQFSFKASTGLSQSFSLLGVTLGGIQGSASFTIDNGGFSGSFSGGFVLDPPLVPSVSAQAQVNLTRAGFLTGNLLGVNFFIDLGKGPFQNIFDQNNLRPTLSINDKSVTEGNSGTTNMTFTVTLSRAINEVVTVPFSLVQDTATAGTDFDTSTTPSSPLTFANNVTSKTITVKIQGDTLIEGDETFFVVLGTPSSNAVINDGRGQGTIINDDFLILLPPPTLGGTVVNYVAGGTIFFDANGDRALDFLDLNGNGTQDPGEPAEPSTITGENGKYNLAVPDLFDRNGDGRLNPEEGALVVLGGIDTSTGLPLQVPLTAAASWTAVTPLTTLATVLVQKDHLTVDDAVARITAGLGLQEVDLLNLDPVAAMIGEVPAAPAVLAANAKVQDTVVQVAHMIQGMSGLDLVSAAGAVMMAMAQHISTGPLQLEAQEDVESLLQAAAKQVGVSFHKDVTATAAQIIAEGNARLDAAAGLGGLNCLTEIVRIEHVAGGKVAADLAKMAAGALSTEDDFEADTGESLSQQIAAAPVGNLAPPVAVDDRVTTAEETPVIIDVLANDHDIDGPLDPASVTVVLGPGHGSLSVDAETGRITYVPDKDFFGSDQLRYVVRDGDGSPSNEAIVSISVENVNDPPVASDDAYILVGDGPLVVPAPGVLQNDSDPDIEVIHAVLVAGPAHGDLALEDDGSFAYTPSAGFRGTDWFTYRASDGSSVSNVATVTLTVTPAVSSPTISPLGTFTVDEGSLLTIPVAAIDPDLSAQALTFGLLQAPAGAALDPGSGVFTWLPADGPDTATVTVLVTNSGTPPLSDAPTFAITVNNVAPTVDAGPDQQGKEGAPVAVMATFTDPGVEDTHTAIIEWGDGTAEPGLVTEERGPGGVHGRVRGTHVYADNGSYTVRVTVADNDGGTGADALCVTVANVAPQIARLVSGAPEVGNAKEGEKVTISGLLTDVGTLDTHTAMVAWGDGATSKADITEADGVGTLTGSHVYTSGGIYNVTMTLADDDGGADTLSTTAYVSGVGLHDGVLQIVGTRSNDQVEVEAEGKRHDGIEVEASFLTERGHERIFREDAVSRIVIVLGGGKDDAAIAEKIRTPALVDGGAGNDNLKAGGGPAVLLGGLGNDVLTGGKGPNVLVGGQGADRLVGGPSDDILIGGTTSYDADREALRAILDEWARTDQSYAQRVAELTSGIGPTGAIKLTGATVVSDGTQDVLCGRGGHNWVFADSQDQLPERAEPEKDRYRAMGPGEEDHSFEPEAKLKPVIDWSGEFPASMLVAKDPYGNGAGKSQGSWVRQFVLNLAEKDLNPNSDICLVLPVSSEL